MTSISLYDASKQTNGSLKLHKLKCLNKILKILKILTRLCTPITFNGLTYYKMKKWRTNSPNTFKLSVTCKKCALFTANVPSRFSKCFLKMLVIKLKPFISVILRELWHIISCLIICYNYIDILTIKIKKKIFFNFLWICKSVRIPTIFSHQYGKIKLFSFYMLFPSYLNVVARW